MQADTQNHGPLGSGYRLAMSVQDERTWSILAHLSMFLNLLTGFLGPVAALIIWLVYRDRSNRVAFHTLQSMWYQIGWLVVLAVGWTVTALLTIIIIGFFLIPAMALISVVPFVHAAYAAYRVSKGDDYRYLLASDIAGPR